MNIEFTSKSTETEIIYGLKNSLGLKNLTIQEREITQTIWDSIFQCTSLESLTLQRCQCKSVPTSITKLSSLKALNLQNSTTETLPEEIGTLKNLQKLTLIGTSIVSLPKGLEACDKLKVLNLRGCNHLVPSTLYFLREKKGLIIINS